MANSSNISNDINKEETGHIFAMTILINLCFAVVGSFTFSLNGIIILGFVRDRTIRESPGNVFIQNLATSDCITGVFLCYVALLNISEWDNDHEYLFRMGSVCALLLASAFFLNYLTFDRYLKVAMHLRYLQFATNSKHHILCIVTWVICVMIGSLPLLGWHQPVVKSLRFFETFTGTYITFIVSLGIAPAFFMTVAYSNLYIISTKHRRRIACLGQTVGGTYTRKSMEVVRSVFLLIGAYLVCWLPLGLYSLIGASMGKDPNETNIPVFTILVTLGFINSLLNPLIYATKISEIRAFFVKVCCRWKNIIRRSERPT